MLSYNRRSKYQLSRALLLLCAAVLTITLFPHTSHANGTISNEDEFAAAALEGGVYVLENDINITSAVMITGNLTITSSYSYPAVPPKLILDAPITVVGSLTEGYVQVIRGAAYTGTLISVNAGGKFEMINRAEINGMASATSLGSAVVVNGTFDFRSGIIRNNYVNTNANGGGVLINGTMNFYEGTITGCRACRGGGIAVSSGAVLNMYGSPGTLSDPSATKIVFNSTKTYSGKGGHGGGVFVNGTFIMLVI